MNFYPIPEWFKVKFENKYDDDLKNKVESFLTEEFKDAVSLREQDLNEIIGYSAKEKTLYIPLKLNVKWSKEVEINILHKYYKIKTYSSHNLPYKRFVFNALNYLKSIDNSTFISKKDKYRLKNFEKEFSSEMKKDIETITELNLRTSINFDSLIVKHNNNCEEIIDNEWFEYNVRRIKKHNLHKEINLNLNKNG